mgnify:CR=1 FL=1
MEVKTNFYRDYTIRELDLDKYIEKMIKSHPDSSPETVAQIKSEAKAMVTAMAQSIMDTEEYNQATEVAYKNY